MLPVLITMLIAVAIPVLVVWWLLRAHRELVLLAWAVHRAQECGEPDGIAQAQGVLRRRLARFPAGYVGRWMGIEDLVPQQTSAPH